VVERSVCPGGRAVANRAVFGEACRCVVRVVSLVKVGQVARAARCRRARETVVRMALDAPETGVGSSEDKTGLAVIECRARPRAGGVAE